jgi:hypothetical protein
LTHTEHILTYIIILLIVLVGVQYFEIRGLEKKLNNKETDAAVFEARELVSKK